MAVAHPTRDQLRQRRERLLRQANATSVAELEERADRGELTGEQYWLWRSIRSIDFLLGEDEQLSATGG